MFYKVSFKYIKIDELEKITQKYFATVLWHLYQ